LTATNALYPPPKSPNAMTADSGLTTPMTSFRPIFAGLRRTLPPGEIFGPYGIVIALVLLVTLVTIGDRHFLSITNIVNMLGQWAPAGIMAVAATYVIIVRGFDLSVASAFSCCAIVAAALGSEGYPSSVAFIAAIAAGLGIGFANASLVAGLSINPFIATVGTSFIILGINLVATPNTYITVTEAGFDALGAGSWFGLTYKAWLLIISLAVGEFVLARTTYGERLYAIGGNPEASRLSGLRVRTLIGSTYVLSGVSAGIAGMLAASQLSTAQARMEPTIVFDVIAVVVVGGTSLSGGVGAVWRTAVGLAIIATISNGFTLLGLDPFYQGLVKGLIIIIALSLDAWSRRTADARLARQAVRRLNLERPTLRNRPNQRITEGEYHDGDI
jgi:ribose transport system permease protein